MIQNLSCIIVSCRSGWQFVYLTGGQLTTQRAGMLFLALDCVRTLLGLELPLSEARSRANMRIRLEDSLRRQRKRSRTANP